MRTTRRPSYDVAMLGLFQLRPVLVGFLVAVLTACASAPKDSMVMEALVIRPSNPDDLPTDTYDAATVIHYAQEAERARDYAKAQRLYERTLREFPDSKWGRVARFGRGRAIEMTKGCAEAAPLYDQIVKEKAEAFEVSEWVNAHFRAASCHLEIKGYPAAIATMDKLLAYDKLAEDDRLEALVGRGIAHKDANELDEAEHDFVMVFTIDREKQGELPPEIRFIVAKAGYHLGEVHRLRFADLKLEYPMEVLEKRLEEKSQELLRAQTYYIRAIRLGDLEAAAAAGYRIGSMYENLHTAIVTLDIPPDLTKEQKEVYNSEVRSKVSVLLKKAVKVFEEAVSMSKRTGLKSEWVARMEESLERIKKLYLADLAGS
jgi:tetratricopeptide (TPR) repeat protein